MSLHCTVLILSVLFFPTAISRGPPAFKPTSFSQKISPIIVQKCNSESTLKKMVNNLPKKIFLQKFQQGALSSSLCIRAGSDEEGYSEDFEDGVQDDFDEDSFDLDTDDDDFEAVEGDFGEDGTVTMIMEMWRTTPPFTKAYLSSALAASTWGWISHKNDFPPYLLLKWEPVLKRLQVWRPFTAFLNFGPFGLSFFLTGHFVWTYMATLEKLNHNRPYDFWVMILFGMVSMVLGYAGLKLSPRFLGHNLSTYLVYIWSRYHEGLEVNMMELFNIRAEMLPWFFIAQTALLEGELPILDMLGLVFGHVYYHFKTTNVLRTPKALINWYNNDSPLSKNLRDKYKKISADFELQQ